MAKSYLKDVRKIYPGGVEAVKGIDFAVADGEFASCSGRRAAASPPCCA